jgi:hypothetical protein
MKHIRYFLDQKKRELEVKTPILKEVLTEAGAKLMALGSARPYRRTGYGIRFRSS